MRKGKRIFAAVFCVMMLASIFTVPAFAAPVVWRQRISTFTEINQSTGGSQPGYTIPLQHFLCCYNTNFETTIMNAGGIDGKFGPATGSCVRTYQSTHGLSVDGSVGPKTWSSIASHLEDVYLNSTTTGFKCGDDFIIRATNSSPYQFYYTTVGGNTTTIWFHTTY
mgnify:CR=1 FL=1